MKKDKLLKAIEEGKIRDDTTLAVFNMVEDLQDRLDTEIPKITDVIERMKGDEGEQGIQGEKGDKGEKGERGEKGEKGADSTVPGPQGIQGKDGKDGISPDYETLAIEASKLTEERLKPFIPTIEQIEADIPKLGEKIVDAINLLPTEDDVDKIDISHIKGVDELESRVTKSIGNNMPTLVAGDTWKNGSGQILGKITVSASQPENPAINDIWFVLP
jgi:hypothetical protein